MKSGSRLLIAALTALLILLPILSSCTDAPQTPSADETAPGTTVETAADTQTAPSSPTSKETGAQTSGADSGSADTTKETADTPTPATPSGTASETPVTPTPVTPSPVTPSPVTLTPYEDPDFGAQPSGVKTVVMSEEDLHKGALLLINKDHPYDPANVKGLVNAFEQIRKVSSGDYLRLMTTELTANPDLVTALVRLQHAMHAELGSEKDLVLRASYMTAAEIEKASTDTKFVFCPGDDPLASEHGAGLGGNLAFIGGGLTYRLFDGGVTAESNYVKNNAARFGLINRYTKIKSSLTGHVEEKDHLRYVGIPHAVYMEEHVLCLEEYIEAIKNYSPDDRLTVTDKDGYTWSVYYVAASETGSTEIPVPEGVVSSISGNNADGFIVTVKAAWDGALSPGGEPTPGGELTPGETTPGGEPVNGGEE